MLSRGVSFCHLPVEVSLLEWGSLVSKVLSYLGWFPGKAEHLCSLHRGASAAAEPPADGTDRVCTHSIASLDCWSDLGVRFIFFLGSVEQRAAFTLRVCSRNSLVPFLFRGRGENSGRFPKNPQPWCPWLSAAGHDSSSGEAGADW